MAFRANPWRTAAAIAIAALAVLAVGSLLYAQQLTGNIYGFVSDEQGGRLPGVSVTLSGVGAPITLPTDARGEYRFLNLAPGRYTIAFELQGFSKVTKTDVTVAVGQNTQTSSVLKLSSVEATITVQGEAPLLETRKVATGATVNYVEMQSIPTARDPWVILQSVPGVQVDRVNVGGNESGQQSNFISKGSSRQSAVWNVDGVTITDMAALGASPTYYDFDSFQEMQISTGGTDLTAATAGVQLNMVTKRGTNDVHGGARMFLADSRWQAKNLPDEAKRQGQKGGGNSVSQTQDYGVEVGGPLWKDRAWLWGSYGRQQIDLLTISGDSDKTTLEGINGKLNVQFLEGTAGTGFYSRDDKLKFGRNAGPTRPPETAWNQTGPTTIYKGEISEVFSSKLFATGSYAFVDGGFQLAPVGGLGVDAYQDANAVWHNSYYLYQTSRPQHQAAANGSYFFNTGTLGHELKFGFQYRVTPVVSSTQWPGSANAGVFRLDSDCSRPPCSLAKLTRTATFGADQEYYNGYFGDTLTAGNLTVNAGVRYDFQRGNPAKATVSANSIISDVLPGFTVKEAPRAFEWKDWSPRVGATYAVGSQRKLLVKGSYARFADQLGAGSIYQQNAIPAYSYLVYYWTDRNGDKKVQRDEIDFGRGIVDFYNVDPNDTTAIAKVFNQTDSNLKAGKTDEIIVGADYELMPDLVVGAAYTYRKYKDQLFGPFIGLTRNDFVPVDLSRGCGAPPRAVTCTTLYTDFNVAAGPPVAIPAFRLTKPVPSGTILENRPDYDQKYNGIDLTLNKRLANKWMARANVTWNNWKQTNGFNGCVDPNNALSTANGASCPGDDIVSVRSAGSGSKAGIFINSRWQFNIAAMYQLPLDFNIAANFFGREGYIYPKWARVRPDALGFRNILVDKTGNPVGAKLDEERHPNVYNLDLRFEKIVNVKPLQVALSADLFNVLNASTVLQRQGRMNLSTFNRIDEVQAPRIWRFGARISF